MANTYMKCMFKLLFANFLNYFSASSGNFWLENSFWMPQVCQVAAIYDALANIGFLAVLYDDEVRSLGALRWIRGFKRSNQQGILLSNSYTKIK